MTGLPGKVDGTLERDLTLLVARGAGADERRAECEMRGCGQGCVLDAVCLIARGPQHLHRRAHRARGDLRLPRLEQRPDAGRGGRAVDLGRPRLGREEHRGLWVAAELATE